jgi:hypothetical protein
VVGERWRQEKTKQNFSLDILVKVFVRDETEKGNKEEKYDEKSDGEVELQVGHILLDEGETVSCFHQAGPHLPKNSAQH